MRNMPMKSVRSAAGAKHRLAGFLAISLLGALPGLAHAAPASAAPSAPAPAAFTVPPAFAPGAAAIAKLSHGAAKILAAFQAAPGIDGYGIEAGPNQDGIVYTTADGHYVFMGDLFGPDGSNLSQTYAQQYLPAAATAQPTTTPAAQLWPELSKLTQIELGSPKAAKHVVIFLDPNCIYCHLTYEAMLPYLKNGSLRLSVVPVGVVKATSIGRAEALLTAKDPVKALAQDEAKFDVTNEEGGLPEAVNPP